jgi:hypothetical protein
VRSCLAQHRASARPVPLAPPAPWRVRLLALPQPPTPCIWRGRAGCRGVARTGRCTTLPPKPAAQPHRRHRAVAEHLRRDNTHRENSPTGAGERLRPDRKCGPESDAASSPLRGSKAKMRRAAAPPAAQELRSTSSAGGASSELVTLNAKKLHMANSSAASARRADVKRGYAKAAVVAAQKRSGAALVLSTPVVASAIQQRPCAARQERPSGTDAQRR